MDLPEMHAVQSNRPFYRTFGVVRSQISRSHVHSRRLAHSPSSSFVAFSHCEAQKICSETKPALHQCDSMATQENGPAGMYKIKPIFDASGPIDLPTCMYSMKSYHDGISTSNQAEAGSSTDRAVAELEKRQEAILVKLETLRSKVNELAQKSGGASQQSSCTIGSTSGLSTSSRVPTNGVIQDLVISANPKSPPLSIAVLYKLLSQQYSVVTACHTHSSVRSGVSDKLKQALGSNGIGQSRGNAQFGLTLIWKDVKHGPTLMVSPSIHTKLQGDGPVARYIARLLQPAYDENDIVTATEIDQYVDLAGTLVSGNAKEKAGVLRTLNGRLGKEQYLVGGQLSLADIVLWSVLHQSNQADSAPANVKKWLDRCSSNSAFSLAQKML